MFELQIVEENSEIAQKYLEKRNEISQSQYHLCNDSFHGKDLFYSKIKLAIADFNNFDELGCPLSNNLMEFKHIMRFATRDSSKLIIFIGELHYDGFIFLIQSNIKHKKIEWINNNYLNNVYCKFKKLNLVKSDLNDYLSIAYNVSAITYPLYAGRFWNIKEFHYLNKTIENVLHLIYEEEIQNILSKVIDLKESITVLKRFKDDLSNKNPYVMDCAFCDTTKPSEYLKLSSQNHSPIGIMEYAITIDRNINDINLNEFYALYLYALIKIVKSIYENE